MGVDFLSPRNDEWAGKVISVYGGLIIVASLLYVSPTGASPEATFIALFGTILLLLPSFAITYLGYWLLQSPFDASHRRRILNWCGWGSLGMASLGAGLVLYFHWIGYPFGDLGYILLLSLAAGGAIGVGFGMKNESVRRQAEQLDRGRQTLLFLNQLLRHNILNGMNVVDGYADLIRSENDRDPAKDVEPILEQSARVTALIEKVRIICASMTGDLPTEPVTLSSVLREIVDSAAESIPDAGITTAIELDVVVVPETVPSSIYSEAR